MVEPRVPLTSLLAKGDRRTIGAAHEVATIVLDDPSRVPELVEGIEHPKAGVRMRSADALQKAAEKRPEILTPYKERILAVSETSRQKEVQWHCAQLLRTMDLTPAELERAYRTTAEYLANSDSAIVRSEAIETLAHLAVLDPSRREASIDTIHNAMRNGSAAVAARGRKVLRKLERFQTERR